MKKRYVNGTLIRVEDYVTSVNFSKHNMEENYPVVRTYRNLMTNIIDVKYNEGSRLENLPKSPMFEPIVDINTLIKYEGKVIPESTVTVNGIEYIFTKNTYNSLSVYLLHNLPELGVTKSKCGVYNNSLYIALVDSDYLQWKIRDYIDFINNSGLIFCHVVDETQFKITNIYSVFFDNRVYNYEDKSIAGLEREFYVNDVTITADFVKQMRERYPEIQFFARGEDKDSTKYNEWINYKITPAHLKHGTLFTSHVWPCAIRGRVWKAALDIEFEYTTNDLPTLMTRRDEFRIGKFLNNDREFDYIIDYGNGEDFNIGYVVFWERDQSETDYGKITSQDDNGYTQFTYKYIGRLGYTNMEDGYTQKSIHVVDSVIYTILYAPPKVDINKYDDGITLLYTDLDYKSFLSEFLQLTQKFENDFGIKIEYNPTTMEITEFDTGTTNYFTMINKELSKMIDSIKSIKQSAIKESNYVMVASLKDAQIMIDKYRQNILEKLNVADFDIEENDIVIDDETTRTMTIESKPNRDLSRFEFEQEKEEPEEEQKPSKEPSDIDIVEHFHNHSENIITSEGVYIPYEETNDNNVIGSGQVKQEVSGNDATVKIDDDEIVDDDEYTVDISLLDKKSPSYGVIL